MHAQGLENLPAPQNTNIEIAVSGDDDNDGEEGGGEEGEMNAAGPFDGKKRYKKKSKELDYNAEIPFEKKVIHWGRERHGETRRETDGHNSWMCVCVCCVLRCT